MAVHHHGRRPGAVRGNRSDPEVHEGRRQTGRQQAHAGSRLKPLTSGKAPPDRPAFQPYWGKPAVRNERGDRGNVGIIRSPVRASILPNPEGPGREETFALCTACHGFRLVSNQGMSRVQWDETLTWMTVRHRMPD